MKKLLQGFSFLGAGISMLVGLGVGKGIGTATSFAVEGVARQPEAVGKIKDVLMIGHFHALIPFIIAFLGASALLCIGIKSHCKEECTSEGNCFIRTMCVIGASISMLGGIGAALGIGEATAYAAEGIARQPESMELIKGVLIQGNLFALIPAIGAFIIAVVLLCLGKKSGRRISKNDKNIKA